MESTPTLWAEVDEQGRLIVPPEYTKQFGLNPGAKMRLEPNGHGLKIHRPVTQLTKIYIEPTVDCNLNCITCFRNAWDQPIGRMTSETFDSVLQGLKLMDTIPDVYFGGIGEPLFHVQTMDWIRQVKALGTRVELITNGTTLVEKKARELLETGLDMLWVSLDGATPESYADVRLGAELPRVVENIRRFAGMRKGGHYPRPEIGIAYVAMQSNIQELPEVIRLGKSMGARHFSVSNLQPATTEMMDERLYTRTMSNIAFLPSNTNPYLSLPKMDFNEVTRDALFSAFNSGCNVSFAGNNWGGANDVCNFIESGTLSIAWNGDVSPCWPLMHNHTSFLHNKPRRVNKHVIGNVKDRILQELWLDPAYVEYREKVQRFAFAPCTFCGGCDLSEANQEDCLGNESPACGGCLWAQGIIQCP